MLLSPFRFRRLHPMSGIGNLPASVYDTNVNLQGPPFASNHLACRREQGFRGVAVCDCNVTQQLVGTKCDTVHLKSLADESSQGRTYFSRRDIRLPAESQVSRQNGG